MKYEKLVSIVVPVYNVSNYVEKCIISLLNQTYQNTEILLVDDGSTDESGAICDKYMKKNSKIRVFHKENGGLSDARNFGIERAKGEYITFVDSDDYVFSNYIFHLVYLMECYQADISVTCATKFFEEGVEPSEDKFILDASIEYTSESGLKDMLYRKNIPIYAVAKMYKSDLFYSIKFPVGELFEDLSTEYLLFDSASKIVFNPVRDYCYLQRRNSIINSKYNSKKMIQVYTTEKIIEFIKENYPSILGSAISKCFITTLNVFKDIPSNKEFINDRQYAKSILIKYRKYVFFDKNNKILTRFIAGISFISIECVVQLGKIYQYLVAHRIIKFKKPI